MHSSGLDGQTVLVTQAGDGFGFILAFAFAKAGAKVALHDRSAAVVAAAVERLQLAVPGTQAWGSKLIWNRLSKPRQCYRG